ncbi:MAG: hypothetical protein QME90_18935, partial [Thermodesulfobacteriota bacterium]|nr:hypothetical protein [Thermodesulfobacteriota bacterium]
KEKRLCNRRCHGPKEVLARECPSRLIKKFAVPTFSKRNSSVNLFGNILKDLFNPCIEIMKDRPSCS